MRPAHALGARTCARCRRTSCSTNSVAICAAAVAVTRFRRSIDPTCAPRPSWAACWVNDLAAEAALKVLGMVAFRKAEDDHVDTVATERVAARTDQEPFAELTYDRVIAAITALGRQTDLMRPVAIDRMLAQFAFAVDHGVTPPGTFPLFLMRPPEENKSGT